MDKIWEQRKSSAFAPHEFFYDQLQALKSKENDPIYCVFLDRRKLSNLMQCYQAFDISSSDPDDIRCLIAGFLLQVADFYGEEREVAVVAMSYLDRFLIERFSTDEENVMINPCSLRSEMTAGGRSIKPGKILDIYALACLGIAIKLFSPTSGCPIRGKLLKDDLSSKRKSRNTENYAVFNGHKNHSLVEIGGGYVNATDIANVEKVILYTLSYRVLPATSYAFVTKLLQLAQDFDDELLLSILNLSKYQLDLISLDSRVLRFPPSFIAAAATSNSIHRHLLKLIPQKGDKSRTCASHKKDVEQMRLLMYRMEEALKLSLEFDHRLTFIRNLLNRLMSRTSFFEQKTEKVSFQESERTSEKATRGSTTIWKEKATCIPKRKHRSDATIETWETSDCFFTLALDAFLPRVDYVDRGKWAEQKKHDANSDLIEHYNRYIRPQLYQQNENLKTSKAKSEVVQPVHLTNEKTIPLFRTRGNSPTPSSDRCSC